GERITSCLWRNCQRCGDTVCCRANVADTQGVESNIVLLRGLNCEHPHVQKRFLQNKAVSNLFLAAPMASNFAGCSQSTASNLKRVSTSSRSAHAFFIFPAREQRGRFRQFFLHVLHLADALGGG